MAIVDFDYRAESIYSPLDNQSQDICYRSSFLGFITNYSRSPRISGFCQPRHKCSYHSSDVISIHQWPKYVLSSKMILLASLERVVHVLSDWDTVLIMYVKQVCVSVCVCVCTWHCDWYHSTLIPGTVTGIIPTWYLALWLASFHLIQLFDQIHCYFLLTSNSKR